MTGPQWVAIVAMSLTAIGLVAVLVMTQAVRNGLTWFCLRALLASELLTAIANSWFIAGHPEAIAFGVSFWFVVGCRAFTAAAALALAWALYPKRGRA